ncbi:putative ribose-5-phosphate isomerase 4 [Arachis hypogaea]|nr:putative ribose-5-phosphate isomerase 4 [Arachis hypogaea]
MPPFSPSVVQSPCSKASPPPSSQATPPSSRCSSSSSFSTKLPLHSSTPLKRSRRRSNHDFLRMVTRSCLDDSSAILRAAQYTVDTYVKSGMVVGLGSGHASGMAIQHLGRQLRTGNLKDIVGIPIASEAAKFGIPLDTYQDSSQIDFAFDDADAIEEGTLVAIIGRRRHKQRRLPHGLASCPPASTRFWIWRFIADESLAIVASSILPRWNYFRFLRFLAQAITLSTCIVAHNNALFALLVSNNIAQIKSNVYKRYSRDNVYSLVYFGKLLCLLEFIFL